MGAPVSNAWGLQAVRRPQASMHKIVTFQASVVMFPLWELPITT